MNARFPNRKWGPAVLMMLAMVALWTQHSRAALINLDVNDHDDTFGGADNYTGAAVIGSAGDQWNYLDKPAGGAGLYSAPNLKTSDGTTTPIRFDITLPAGLGGNDHNGTTNALFDDYLFVVNSGSTAPFSIWLLKPNTSYDLYLYSSTNSGALGGKFIIGASTKTMTGAASTSFVQNGNYVVFSGISSDGSGNIDGTFTINGTFGIFDGFQIQGEIPEPASLGVIAVGAMFALRRGVRRRVL